jgi:hypothetical protein
MVGDLRIDHTSPLNQLDNFPPLSEEEVDVRSAVGWQAQAFNGLFRHWDIITYMQ